MNAELAKQWRKKAKLTQEQFWPRVGVTQSAGSRYESGRAIPKPVQLLLQIAYGPKWTKTISDLRR